MSSDRNERGSTILEVVAALAVLSALGIGAWHAAGVSLRLAARLKATIAADARMLQLDDGLRGLAGRVLLPYWAPDGIVRVAEGELSVPWLDGDSSKCMSLEFQEGVLVLGDGETCMRYRDFQRVDFSPAVDDEHHQYGVSVQGENADGRRFRITARFGSTPLGSIPSP